MIKSLPVWRLIKNDKEKLTQRQYYSELGRVGVNKFQLNRKILTHFKRTKVNFNDVYSDIH